MLEIRPELANVLRVVFDWAGVCACMYIFFRRQRMSAEAEFGMWLFVGWVLAIINFIL